MISYHIYLAVMQAHKQSQMDAARAAEQARLHRLGAGSPDARRSLRGRIGSRLGLYWSRVGGHRLRPGRRAGRWCCSTGQRW